MAGYNYVMSIYSLITFVLSSLALWRIPLYTNDCNRLTQDPLFLWVSIVFYWSKFVEYFDTLFLYVRGVPVTYLHWFHHIGAAVNLFFGIKYNGEALWIFVWLNSFIHILMYWYYAASIFRTNEKGLIDTLKPFVTLIQIVQFNTGFYFLYQYPRKVPCWKRDHFRMIGVYYYTWFYVGGVLLLFVNFFIRSYLCPKKSNKSRKSLSVTPTTPVPVSPQTPTKAPDSEPPPKPKGKSTKSE